GNPHLPWLIANPDLEFLDCERLFEHGGAPRAPQVLRPLWMGFRRDRAGGSLQSRVNLQLRQNALHMLSHRLGRDRQIGSDLLAGTPDDEKLEHPLLLLGQLFSPWPVHWRPPGVAQTEYPPSGPAREASAHSAMLVRCSPGTSGATIRIEGVDGDSSAAEGTARDP